MEQRTRSMRDLSLKISSVWLSSTQLSMLRAHTGTREATTYDEFRCITISPVLLKIFEHRSMNGFQTLLHEWRCRRWYGVPTAAGQQQQQQRGWGQAGALAGSDNFRGVGIGNGSSCINLWRLLRSVPRGATCWLRTGAVRICAVVFAGAIHKQRRVRIDNQAHSLHRLWAGEGETQFS